jgi:hypothetical protein
VYRVQEVEGGMPPYELDAVRGHALKASAQGMFLPPKWG